MAKVLPGVGPTVIQTFAVDPAGPAATPIVDPPADLDVAMTEFMFDLPAEIPAGQQSWRITNTGQQVHELELVHVPDGTTLEQVQAGFASPLGATPVPGEFNYSRDALFAGHDLAGGLGLLSPGATAWLALDLAPGSYAAFCLVLDVSTGQPVPHSAMGMVALVTATTSATPVP